MLEIAPASNNTLYKVLKNGQIWRLLSPIDRTWELINANADNQHIIASESGKLYELHRDGSAWAFDGSPYCWHFLSGSNDRVIQLAAGETNELYQLRKDGKVFSMTTGEEWELIGDKTQAKSIFTAGTDLYLVLKDRSILKYRGLSMGTNRWQTLDCDQASTQVVACSAGTVWQVRDGEVFERRA